MAGCSFLALFCKLWKVSPAFLLAGLKPDLEWANFKKLLKSVHWVFERLAHFKQHSYLNWGFSGLNDNGSRRTEKSDQKVDCWTPYTSFKYLLCCTCINDNGKPNCIGFEPDESACNNTRRGERERERRSQGQRHEFLNRPSSSFCSRGRRNPDSSLSFLVKGRCILLEFDFQQRRSCDPSSNAPNFRLKMKILFPMCCCFKYLSSKTMYFQQFVTKENDRVRRIFFSLQTNISWIRTFP